MSGVFNPNEPGIRATDDPAVAKAHGLTEFDEQRGQYVAPRKDNEQRAGERDERAARLEAQQVEETDRTEREARDEDPAEHDALKRGLAPGEKPAAAESGNAEPLIVQPAGDPGSEVVEVPDGSQDKDDKGATGKGRTRK